MSVFNPIVRFLRRIARFIIFSPCVPDVAPKRKKIPNTTQELAMSKCKTKGKKKK